LPQKFAPNKFLTVDEITCVVLVTRLPCLEQQIQPERKFANMFLPCFFYFTPAGFCWKLTPFPAIILSSLRDCPNQSLFFSFSAVLRKISRQNSPLSYGFPFFCAAVFQTVITHRIINFSLIGLTVKGNTTNLIFFDPPATILIIPAHHKKILTKNVNRVRRNPVSDNGQPWPGKPLPPYISVQTRNLSLLFPR
jgi:hypothetical protein